MGTSTNPAQFARKLDKFATDLGDPRPALNKTGLAGKQIFLAAAGGIIGTKPAGKRKLINARYQISRDGRGVIVTYTGPAHLLANPTRPHDIFPRRRPGVSSRRRKGSRALTINGDARASAHHPGTRGKPFAKQAKATAIRTLPAVMQRAAISEPLRRAFH